MTIRTYCTLAAAIFALIALLQSIRIVMDWSVTLNGVEGPFWVSWIVVTFQKADLSLAVESTKDTPSPIFP